jgi:hypothetical protein
MIDRDDEEDHLFWVQWLVYMIGTMVRHPGLSQLLVPIINANSIKSISTSSQIGIVRALRFEPSGSFVADLMEIGIHVDVKELIRQRQWDRCALLDVIVANADVPSAVFDLRSFTNRDALRALVVRMYGNTLSPSYHESIDRATPLFSALMDVNDVPRVPISRTTPPTPKTPEDGDATDVDTDLLLQAFQWHGYDVFDARSFGRTWVYDLIGWSPLNILQTVLPYVPNIEEFLHRPDDNGRTAWQQVGDSKKRYEDMMANLDYRYQTQQSGALIQAHYPKNLKAWAAIVDTLNKAVGY